jgi:uncharacterized membrane protein YeaQ/YmgE (transglycosylase-associated protein family)
MDLSQMSWLAWIIVGALAGWLASIVMKTNGKQGLLLDIVVGVFGAFVGGFLFSQFGSTGVTGFNIWSVFVSFTGAVILLAVIRLVNGQKLLGR